VISFAHKSFGNISTAGSVVLNTRAPRGDMQSGTDRRILAGDMQSGTDARKTQETL
jgi:hypothetical protein